MRCLLAGKRFFFYIYEVITWGKKKALLITTSPVYICNTRLFKYLFLKTKSFSWDPKKKSISGKMHWKFARERLMATVTIMKAMSRVDIHSALKASAALHDLAAAFVPFPLPLPRPGSLIRGKQISKKSARENTDLDMSQRIAGCMNEMKNRM